MAKKAEVYFDKDVEVSFLVTQVNYHAAYISSYNAKLISIDGNKYSTYAIVEFEYDAMLELGDLISGKFRVNSIDSYADSSQYYLAKNITMHIAPASEEMSILHGQDDLALKIYKLNQKLSDIICNNIDDEAGNLISALILGNKDLLSAETVRDFKRAGISHVIAISGMHLSVLMLIFDFALKKARIRKGIRSGIVITVALFYLALTGFALSTVRAFVMSAFVYIAYLCNEDSDMLTNLLFALFFIIAVSPSAVYDVGLWLSFLAVLGIFVSDYFINKFSDYLYSKVKPADKYAKKMSPITAKLLISIFSSVLITISANVFICVPAWIYFDAISTISVISNLIVSPIVSFILFLSPLFIAVHKIPFLSDVIAQIIKFTCDRLLHLISFIASFEWATVSLNYSFAGPIVISLAIALTLCLILKFKRKWIIAIPPIVAAALFSICIFIYNQYYDQMLKVEYLGSDESEMLLIQDSDDYVIIDISSGAYTYAYCAYEYAVESCATEISSYVITHYHTKQVNSLYKLSKQTIIRKLYLPYPQNAEEYYQMSSLITTAINANIDVEIYDTYSKTQISENTSLTLSLRTYLKRSTHPIFYFTLDTPTKTLTYSSESVSDDSVLKEKLFSVLNNSNYIFFGVHGPITKNDFDYDGLKTGKRIIIANNDIAEHFVQENISDFYISSNVSYAKILIPKE